MIVRQVLVAVRTEGNTGGFTPRFIDSWMPGAVITSLPSITQQKPFSLLQE